ncbi:MAG: multidrug efflux RND transporter permease subunit [Tepidisphaeraceae bacterium]
MKLGHFFIDRPVFAAVLSIVTILVGAIAMFNLPVAQYPEIAPPTVVVNARYPGANAQVVSDSIATPIEQQINGVENMLYMSSQCNNDGSLQLTVTFALGTDLDIAQVQVQNRVALAEPQLPEEVRRQGVTVRKSSPDITLVIQLFSPGEKFDRLYLSNFATLNVRDQIARVAGVGDIRVFGARDYAMRLWVDPQKMTARGITAGDVVAAVREQNVQVAAGVVGAPPLPPGAADFQFTVNAQGQLQTEEEFGDIVVKRGEGGRVTRVRDVATVKLDAADYATATLYNNQPAVGVAVFQLPGSNAINTANAIYAKMGELKATFPQGIEYSIPYDTTLYVRASIRDVIKTLLEAIALVVIVVLVFLQSWRASLVPLLAIPVSLIGTFAFMKVFGFSLNNLSLFGIVLAIGIVVDDAIVVVENVERWIEQGLSARDATYRAMTEVTPAVIAIAFGLSAVFIPVAFISGITGQFYKQFALTISISTLLSAFNSLTLSPALAALLLRPKHGRQDLFTRLMNLVLGWFFKLFNRTLELGTNGYVGVVRRAVRVAVIPLLVYVGLGFLGYLGFRTVPTGFIPSQDQGYLLVNLQMPDAASFDRTYETMERLMKIGLAAPGVQDGVAIVGFSFLTGGSQSNAATMFLPLKPFDERAEHPEQSATALMGRLMGEFSQVQEGIALVFPPPPVRGIGTAGGFKMLVQDRTGSGDFKALETINNNLMAAARERPEFAALFTSFRASVPQLKVEVDRMRVKQQGIAMTDVFDTLGVFLGSQYINDFTFLGRVFRVIAQSDARFRATAEDIGQFQTRNSAGQMVPLGSVLQVKEITAPDRIQRYNLYPAADLQGAGVPGVSSGQAISVMEGLAAERLPPGYAFEWTELSFQEKLAGNTAMLIFPLCVLFVWLTHSAEYESFALSSAIILIVPMCLVAGIGGVWLVGQENNIFTQIGFVVLVGLSAKNAVLIVEFAKQQEEQGKGYVEAAVEAARLRLRPILMTSFAFILGVLPMVRATGAGAEMRHALGTVVFWGMIGVTIFGIFLTPVFYVVIRWLGTKMGMRPPHHLPPPPEAAKVGANHGTGALEHAHELVHR